MVPVISGLLCLRPFLIEVLDDILYNSVCFYLQRRRLWEGTTNKTHTFLLVLLLFFYLFLLQNPPPPSSFLKLGGGDPIQAEEPDPLGYHP